MPQAAINVALPTQCRAGQPPCLNSRWYRVEVWYLCELIRITRQVAMRGTPSFALRIGYAERKV
ncbi:hypothetical protein LR48_Vigan11g109900 [Vigna angularis]|uniref:Uncharacterized protein n=1 Tax=Phaseolus angularis TaxID=3914 RepID=A0A0L9VSL5_PHAAN|nr:hypothetical protein LR48_Vigan11g109900 [Vigna angularis]